MGELLAALLASLGDLLQSVIGRTPSKRLRTYSDSERAVVIAAGTRTREWIRAAGNRAYVWGSPTGGYSLLRADTAAPPDQIRFRTLRDESDPTSFHLLLEEGLDLGALLITYRRWPRPVLDAQPYSP
jgi:hypothetical protein